MTNFLSPVIRQEAFQLGITAPGAVLHFYLSGTTTPTEVFSLDGVSLGTTLAADSTGMFAAFCLGAWTYRMTLLDSGGATIWGPEDNISTASQSAIAVPGTAGVTLTAGDTVYLSDGSGGLTAGYWYKADADFAYASARATQIGIAAANIAALAIGSINITGRVTGLSGLVAGAAYYVSATAGALTATPPTNIRFVGTADTATSIILGGAQTEQIDNGTCDGRLTLTTGVPVTITDVTAATTIYFTPYQGSIVRLYTGTVWQSYPLSEVSLSLALLTASRPHDVFLFDTAGTLTLEAVAWTSDTARATAITLQNGVYVKSGSTNKRWVGTFRTTTSVGQTEDSLANRFVYNAQNRVRRAVRIIDTTNSWNYTTATLRQANAPAANQINIINGLALYGETINLDLQAHASNGTGGLNVVVAIGENATNASAANGQPVNLGIIAGQAGAILPLRTSLSTSPALGYSFYAWLEYSGATGTTTWYGDNNTPTILQSGLSGTWTC